MESEREKTQKVVRDKIKREKEAGLFCIEDEGKA